jgi:hypothetical protein
MFRAISEKLSIRKLIFPFDVKSATPEMVFAFDLDSHALGHTDKDYLKDGVMRILFGASEQNASRNFYSIRKARLGAISQS